MVFKMMFPLLSSHKFKIKLDNLLINISNFGIPMLLFGYEVSIFYIFLGAIVLSLVCTLSFLSRSGLFYTLTLRFSCPTPDVLPQKVAYLLAQGPYRQAGMLVRETMDLAHNAKVFAIYYDDPEEVAQTDLHYLVGCMLPETNSAQSEVLTNRLTKSGYKLYTFPACTNALITEFPNYTGISLFLANWRILPEIKRIMNKHKHTQFPLIEVYGKTYIKYLVPIDNMAKFYVIGVTRKQKTHVE